MSFPLLLALAIFSTGCAKSEGQPSGTPASDSGNPTTQPWDGLEPVPLSTFRELRQTILNQAQQPQGLVLEHHHGQAFVLDHEAQAVWATDTLYLHDPRPVCIDPNHVQASSALDDQTECPAGTTKVARGHIETPSQPIAIAAQTNGGKVAILEHSGQLHWLPTNMVEASSFDFMRPVVGPNLAIDVNAANTVLLGTTEDEIAVTTDNVLRVFELDGTPKHEWVHDGTIRDIHQDDGAWWVTTDTATYKNGQEAGPGGMALVPHADTIWVLTRSDMVAIDSDLPSIALENPSGHAVFWRERLLYTSPDGVMESNHDGDRLIISDEIVDFGVNDAQELVVLDGNNRLRVFVDETMYSSRHSLHVWGSTFIEKPRKSQNAMACDGPQNSIQAVHEQAISNLRLLRNLPTRFSLGVTPAHWRRAVQCGATEPLQRLVSHLELGSLFHDAPLECESDQDCYVAALQTDLHGFTESLHWVSGLGAHTQLSVDWVEALQELNAPNQYAFFGMSLRPEVPHDDDFRAKNSWPTTLGDHSRTWAADSVFDIPNMNDSGWLRILPGNNIPLFNLGACANLLLRECHPLGRGNGGAIGTTDIESLRILLHRAMMSAQKSVGTHTWNFHLPDIGEYDYTDGCAVEDGRWSGDACGAAKIQEWLFDVHWRLVENGLMQWSTPGEVGQP